MVAKPQLSIAAGIDVGRLSVMELPAEKRSELRGRAIWGVILALAVALSVLAIVQASHGASRGRGALLKWAPVFEALSKGEPIYRVGAEGYPTLPLSLLLLWPFHSLGRALGPVAWAAAQVAMAWWIVTRALALAAGRVRDFPKIGVLLVLLLSFRVLLSDVRHGNINLIVGAGVATAAWEWSRGREFRSGLWISFAAVLKVTPLLGLAYFAWKRSLRGASGTLLGIFLFALVVPGFWLGFERNFGLASSWFEQMVAPYLAGREPGLLHTEHINQSLFGVLARLTTDSVAIVARPPIFPEDLRVNLLSLSATGFRTLHLLAGALVLAAAALCIRAGRVRRGSWETLGEFALWSLAMVFLSERSWKHHYVLLAFPIAYLVWTATRYGRRTPLGRIAIAGLVASACLHGLTGSGVLGARGSDLAEAYGAYLAGGLALFASVGLILRRTSALSRLDERRGPVL